LRQINLVVGDIFTSNSDLLKYTDLAAELITWLRSKTFVLGKLPYAVLRAVLTRWTAHYNAYRRLLDLYIPLKFLVDHDARHPGSENERQRILITGNKKAQEKAEAMVRIIRDPLFWHKLTL
jgi:hypothetical protein